MLAETEKYKLSVYNIKEMLHGSNNCDIYLTQSSIDNKLYIKRVYKNSNLSELFNKIKNKNVRYIPKIYEIFYDDKDTIVIEEYILGYTIDSVNISKKVLFKAIDNVLSSIEDLHSINIIHRDIKPSNIMITKEQNIYLIDFGIARFYTDTVDSDTTKLGTKGFASPEQFGFQQTDFRSDIYSVGKTIDYLLKSNDIKTNLKGVISKASAFAPDDRYKSAAELKRAIKLRVYAPAIIAFCTALIVLVLCIIAFVIFRNNKKPSYNYEADETSDTTTEITIHETSEITTLTYTEITTLTYTEITTTSALTTTKAMAVVKPNTSEVKSTAKAETTVTPNTSTPVTPNTSTPEPSDENTTTSDNVNILRISNHNNYFSKVLLPDDTPYMEMLGAEKQKSCRIAINNTCVTVECVRNDLTLTVNLSDELGHKESLSMSFTQEEIDDVNSSKMYPPQSFNTYIYFIDYNNDGNIEIFVNYTDAGQWIHDTGARVIRQDGTPYIFYHYNRLMLLDHTSEKGFYLYKQIMKPSVYYNIIIDGSKYPGCIAVPSGSFMYKIENGTIVESYM